MNKSGWNMLDSYTEGQTIYGRDNEISLISESIINNVQTFLYGKSGIGKTSLLQAGVFPILRKEKLFPVNIRIAFYNNENLRDVIKRLVEEEAAKENVLINKPKLGFNTIDGSDVSGCSLFEYFSKVKFSDVFGTTYIPVLLFDQFEEAINNEECWQHTTDFLKDELYDLLDNSIAFTGEALPYTNYRIVISMREDYLYCLEDIIDKYSLNELRYNKFRVTALKDAQAAKVIQMTCGEEGIERGKENKIITTILDYVKKNSSARFSEINTALLSLVCSLLSANSPDGCIKYIELRDINKLLGSFYDVTCTKLKIRGRTRNYLEKNLLTKDGRRSSFDKDEALLSGKISQEQLDGLVENRILRCVPIDSVSCRYEFIHDLFAKMVSKQRSENRRNRFKAGYIQISQTLPRNEFTQKIILCTSLIITFGLFLFWVLPSILNYSTGELIIPGLDINVLGHTITFDVIIWLTFYYNIPLFARRIHDIGFSGWLLLIIPISIFLVYIGNIQRYSSFVISQILQGTGFIIMIILVLICFIQESNTNPYRLGYSKIYEAISRHSHISNMEFIKGFCVECICLFFVVASTSMIKELLFSDVISFDGLVVKYKYQFLPFGFNRTLIALFSFIFFSPSLRARISSMGYFIDLSCFPILNVLLLIEGLLPDYILKQLHLMADGINSPQNRSVSGRDDEILIDLSDELNVPRIHNKISYSFSIIFALFSCLIPFVSFYFAFRKKSFARLSTTCVTGGYNGILSCLLSIFCKNLFESIISGLYFITWIFSLVYVIRKIDDDIINALKSSTNKNAQSIQFELGLNENIIDRRIKRLQKKGILNRSINNQGDIEWEVYDNIPQK